MKIIKQVLITAIVAALVSGVGVPYAKKHLINGSTIRKGTITGKQVRFPAAQQLHPGARAASSRAHASVTDQFTPVAILGTYDKGDPNSVLRVDWTGGAGVQNSPCEFQIRVDGQPGAGGDVVVYQSAEWIATSALYSGLPTGVHEVEVYARLSNFAGQDYGCFVDPDVKAPRSVGTVTELVQ
jgi:hypothetical protein